MGRIHTNPPQGTLGNKIGVQAALSQVVPEDRCQRDDYSHSVLLCSKDAFVRGTGIAICHYKWKGNLAAWNAGVTLRPLHRIERKANIPGCRISKEKTVQLLAGFLCLNNLEQAGSPKEKIEIVSLHIKNTKSCLNILVTLFNDSYPAYKRLQHKGYSLQRQPPPTRG